MDPSRRVATVVLALGVVVLVAAIVIGERMGDRVMLQTQNTATGPAPMPLVTPVSMPTTAPYGPNWKDTQVLAAAPDPGFPDPRVPPVPLPTLRPTPATPRPSPKPTWTPNPNIPIWDQTPPPEGPATPTPQPTATPSPFAQDVSPVPASPTP
jgi:hypothetical protein